MDKQISQIRGIIKKTKSSKDYARLRTIIEQNVYVYLLNDKKVMLFAALLALL